ncbi:hypothetical protein SAMN06265338_13416 [Rhodoblastus acidophilus]|uniref:Uncharacterized protein n=1 Tax=Rhodoblastus acidophilus TaxID=1074 RepID=A0A212SF20_RHOAC|nr:hypothetical protein [Rhodoblastus acidophilus]PPQ37097.1 hypothetical protein CKO16_16025 [Rhodoblastus acidophilus]RAI16718.1 hypothetical protein CH337_19870 [Rhodoblastus acidophilus]SNB84258.1 hypothetical protein SAMN06265338_13416 [Rhodoblastus acidophilus]
MRTIQIYSAELLAFYEASLAAHRRNLSGVTGENRADLIETNFAAHASALLDALPVEGPGILRQVALDLRTSPAPKPALPASRWARVLGWTAECWPYALPVAALVGCVVADALGFLP